MTNEQLNQYYSKDADKKQCWVSKDHNCPLKEQCNGLVKPECKEHIDNEEACHVVDKMIEWYYQVEEPEFLKFYNCHLEMLERHGRPQTHVNRMMYQMIIYHQVTILNILPLV